SGAGGFRRSRPPVSLAMVLRLWYRDLTARMMSHQTSDGPSSVPSCFGLSAPK
ncbi:hypothetical protein HAX54_034106, partial [Datura stramonium]|nr:hypothetical protein [Datura stramonium]